MLDTFYYWEVFGSSINLPNRSSINKRPDESAVSGYAEAARQWQSLGARSWAPSEAEPLTVQQAPEVTLFSGMLPPLPLSFLSAWPQEESPSVPSSQALRIQLCRCLPFRPPTIYSRASALVLEML